MAVSFSQRTKLGLAGGLAAVVLGGAVFGTALARPGGPDQGSGTWQERREAAEERREAFVDRLAANLGVSEEKLRDALIKTRVEMVDEAVKAGRLTPEQGERIKEHIRQSGGTGLAPHHGPRDGMHGGPIGVVMSVAGQTLGLSPPELRAKLHEGKSLREIAVELGRDPRKVKDEIVAGIRSRIDEAVKAGRLPAERAEEMKSRVEQHVERLMDFRWGPGSGPDRGPKHGPGGPRRGV